MPYDVDPVLAPHLGLENGLGGDITEIDVAVGIVKVQRHHVAQVLNDQVVAGGVRGHVAEVVLVGEQDPGRGSAFAALARPAVRLSLIVVDITLAGEGPLQVDALLTAGLVHRHVHAFVDVRTGLSILH